MLTLKKSVQEGKVPMAQIDAACRRILEAKYKLGLFDDPYKNLKNDEKAKNLIFTASSKEFAKEAATHSMVLLKNENNTLPLKKQAVIALIGPLADNKRDMIGPHAAAGDWNQNVSVMDGLNLFSTTIN